VARYNSVMKVKLLVLCLCAWLAAGAGAAQAQPKLNPHDEATRLIDGLGLSNAQRNAARDFVIIEMAKGGTPRAALQQWVGMQQARGIRIRCRPGAASECVAR
jgi:hypothetical protein